MTAHHLSVPVDDPSLRESRTCAGGVFFTATSADELQNSYRILQQQIGYDTALGDAGKPWLILGSVLTALAAGTALVPTPRLP